MDKRPAKKRFEWTLPKNLKFMRDKLNLSLDDVAYSTGLSKAFISQIENKQSVNISVQTAAILCGDFGKDIYSMCFGDITY